MLPVDLLPERVARRLYREAVYLVEMSVTFYARQGVELPAADLSPQLLDHLHVLADAVLMSSPGLFVAHLAQMRLVGPSPARDQELRRQLNALRQTLLLQLPVRYFELTNVVLTAAVHLLAEDDALPAPADGLDIPRQSVQPIDAALVALADAYLHTLLTGTRREAIAVLTEAALDTPVHDLYLHVLQPVLREVGERWHAGQLSVAEEHYCTTTSELVMGQLYPLLVQRPRYGRRLVATAVAGDLHITGLRMVADFLEYDGWDVFYLGASTPTPDLLRLLTDRRAELLVLAASMPHHVPLTRQIIADLRQLPGGAAVRVLVGGRPFNQSATLWQEVGADGSAPDAWQAVLAARQLFGLQAG